MQTKKLEVIICPPKIKMQSELHPFHSVDYEYLRPSKSRITGQKGPIDEFTHYKGEPQYRNLYYGTNIPEDQFKKTMEFNDMLKRDLANGTIAPHLPEFWSLHDSWRFADAAGYREEHMCRDAVNHSLWIEQMKDFRLTPEGAKQLTDGVITVYGRDKRGFPIFWVDFKKADTSTKGCEAAENALIFASAVVKKYMLLPYHCELFNIVIDVGNCSVFSLSKKFLSTVMGLHQTHFKNSMLKLIIYNPSFTLYALWKTISLVYNKKYLERVRIVKKGNEKDLWEILDPEQTPIRCKGTAPDIQQFWPPLSLEKDPITVEEIKAQNLMTFDFIGHQADTKVFLKYKPFEEPPTPKGDDPVWYNLTGKLDKTLYP